MPRVRSSLFHVEWQLYLKHAVVEDVHNESTSSGLPKASFRTSKRFPILQVVTEGLDMEATEPRDKIFALLTFGEETRDISQLHQHARPNYENQRLKCSRTLQSGGSRIMAGSTSCLLYTPSPGLRGLTCQRMELLLLLRAKSTTRRNHPGPSGTKGVANGALEP